MLGYPCDDVHGGNVHDAHMHKPPPPTCNSIYAQVRDPKEKRVERWGDNGRATSDFRFRGLKPGRLQSGMLQSGAARDGDILVCGKWCDAAHQDAHRLWATNLRSAMGNSSMPTKVPCGRLQLSELMHVQEVQRKGVGRMGTLWCSSSEKLIR